MELVPPDQCLRPWTPLSPSDYRQSSIGIGKLKTVLNPKITWSTSKEPTPQIPISPRLARLHSVKTEPYRPNLPEANDSPLRFIDHGFAREAAQ